MVRQLWYTFIGDVRQFASRVKNELLGKQIGSSVKIYITGEVNCLVGNKYIIHKANYLFGKKKNTNEFSLPGGNVVILRTKKKVNM